MNLRYYQDEAIKACFKSWEVFQKILLVLATGTGKTIIFSKIAQMLVAKNKRVLILAHRDELINQAVDKLNQSTKLSCAIEKASQHALDSFFPIVIGSVQTMQGKRLEAFPKDHFDVIIIDEAHLALSPTYINILNHFDQAKVLGVTATPERGDKKCLGEIFEYIAYEYDLKQGIKDEYLTPLKALVCPLKIDLGKLSVKMGDYSENDVAHALEPYLEEIADEMLRSVSDRNSLVFLPLIRTSKMFTQLLNDRGFNAIHVDGVDKQRKKKIADWEEGKYNVLCCSMLFTVGFDSPRIDCIVPLRPTKVRTLYRQMIGRGTRLSPDTGKDHLLILDFLWHSEKLSLCSPASLFAVSAEMDERIRAKLDPDVPTSLLDVEYDAEKDAAEEREDALAKALARNKNRNKKLVNPLDFAVATGESGLSDYEAVMGWELKRPTDQQLEFMTKHNIDVESVTNRGQATKIIDCIITRQSKGLATPKQVMLLRRHKRFSAAHTWTFEYAQGIIGKLAQANWNPYRVTL